MHKYVVSSESPIHAEEVNGPSPGEPGHPWVPPGWTKPEWPERPAHPWIPSLPPRDEWPSLPPWFGPGVGLPIPPSPEFPMVPVPPGEPDGPDIWPPVRPEFPDLGGKTLALALIYVSRHVAKWHWVIIDHEEFKTKWQAIKDKLPKPGQGLPGQIIPR